MYVSNPVPISATWIHQKSSVPLSTRVCQTKIVLLVLVVEDWTTEPTPVSWQMKCHVLRGAKSGFVKLMVCAKPILVKDVSAVSKRLGKLENRIFLMST